MTIRYCQSLIQRKRKTSTRISGWLTEGLWPSRNDEFRVMLWGREAGNLSITGSQGWSAILLQHTQLLYVARIGSGGHGCPPQNQLIVKAGATVGSPPAALVWGESLGTRDLPETESPAESAPPEQSGILASLTAVYFRPLAISPALPITPHDGKNPLQELAQECNISRIKMDFCFHEQQRQHTARLRCWS